MSGGWLGLDIGTSSLKALLVSDDGTPTARASVTYEGVRSVRDGIAEQDPRVWIDAARRAIAQCLDGRAAPEGIGLTGQVPTLVLLDEDGEPVRSAMTWQDSRAADQAARLKGEFGPSRAHLGVDLPWSAAHLPAKLAWIAEHEPENVARTHTALQPKDFLGAALTGSTATDPWSAKGMINIEHRAPAEAVLAACGWTPAICPPIVDAGMSRGETRPNDLGLPAGIPVSVGWSDALASMLAVGAFSQRMAFILTGTSEVVGLSLDKSVDDPAGLYMLPDNCVPRPVLYGPTQSGGATVSWLSALFKMPIEELFNAAASARPGDGPVFVPYLNGERAPLWNSEVRALFAGISDGDGAPELIRAALRGVALSAAHILNVASTSTGLGIDTVHIAGRGIEDITWKDVRRETLGVPVLFHPEPYIAALGAAMLGAAAAHGGDLSRANRLRGEFVAGEPGQASPRPSADVLERYRRASNLALSWSS